MTLKLAAAFLIATLVAGDATAGELGGLTVKQMLDGECSTPSDECIGDLNVMIGMLSVMGAPAAKCIPQDQAMAIIDKQVIAWLREHSETWSMKSGTGAVTALAALYPCKQ
jgi:hypothetical protein